MKRSGFKRPTIEKPTRPPLSPPSTPAKAKMTAHAELTAAPKGVKAKPGKRAPTAEEKRWMDAITAFGCVACWLDEEPPRPTAVHHILRGGQRMGHRFTLPLCDPGHHQEGEAVGLVSRHPFKARFEKRYGTEDELLRRMCGLLGWEYPG